MGNARAFFTSRGRPEWRSNYPSIEPLIYKPLLWPYLVNSRLSRSSASHCDHRRSIDGIASPLASRMRSPPDELRGEIPLSNVDAAISSDANSLEQRMLFR